MSYVPSVGVETAACGVWIILVAIADVVEDERSYRSLSRRQIQTTKEFPLLEMLVSLSSSFRESPKWVLSTCGSLML